MSAAVMSKNGDRIIAEALAIIDLVMIETVN
jgi:hypothetical protein